MIRSSNVASPNPSFNAGRVSHGSHPYVASPNASFNLGRVPSPNASFNLGRVPNGSRSNSPTNSTMFYVGQGQGEFDELTTYKYVGQGAGSFSPAMPKPKQNCWLWVLQHLSCIFAGCFVGVFIAALLIFLQRFLRPNTTTTTTPTLTTAKEVCDLGECAHYVGQGRGECKKNIQVFCCVRDGGHTRQCCDELVDPLFQSHISNCRALVKDTFDCDEGYKNWEKEWDAAKVDWCCSNKGRACVLNGGLPPDWEGGLKGGLTFCQGKCASKQDCVAFIMYQMAELEGFCRFFKNVVIGECPFIQRSSAPFPSVWVRSDQVTPVPPNEPQGITTWPGSPAFTYFKDRVCSLGHGGVPYVK